MFGLGKGRLRHFATQPRRSRYHPRTQEFEREERRRIYFNWPPVLNGSGLIVGGTSELIDPELTGLLYRGGWEELAACMGRYVESPELAWQHGQAGWHVARRRHSTEAYAAQIYEILRGRQHGHSRHCRGAFSDRG